MMAIIDDVFGIDEVFGARRHQKNGQVPPGQYVTNDFPVLSAGHGAAAAGHHGRHPLRHRMVQTGDHVPLEGKAWIAYTYEAEYAPGGDGRPPGRPDLTEFTERVISVDRNPEIRVCGPTAFVEHYAQWPVDLGYPAATIRTERFGG